MDPGNKNQPSINHIHVFGCLWIFVSCRNDYTGQFVQFTSSLFHERLPACIQVIHISQDAITLNALILRSPIGKL